MSAIIKDNSDKFNKIIRDLKSLEKLEAKVGIFSDAGGSFKGERILDYSTLQEFGNKSTGGYVPERSFIRSTADENNYWIDNINNAEIDVIEGKESPGEALTQVAIRARDDIKKKILNGDDKWKPLKSSTIKKKGSSIKYKIALKD
jgi:hypothetical protein